ncbi:formylglycine-generating enzyme family protein [Planctomycetota bacterium]
MKKIVMIVIFVGVMAVANTASATIVQGIDIDFVTIGNAGNAGDTRIGYPDSPYPWNFSPADSANPYGCGAVGYDYRIGKYEVTNAQWNQFTSAVGAPTGNPSNAYDENATYTDGQQPVNNVSWYEALQFCNYLTSGNKSLGAYLFSGNNTNPGDFLGINRDLAISTYGTAYVIPTENEWYKAAYYTGIDYSTYANGTGVAPIAGDDTNYDGVIGQPWDVGTGIEEQNYTFDMMGNLFEWNETLVNTETESHRGIRGGSYYPHLDFDISLRSSYRVHYNMFSEDIDVGIRVASVPEPCTLALMGLGLLALRTRKP